MNCTNCHGLLQLGERNWLCAWCGRSGAYALGPALANGRCWRLLVTTERGRFEYHRAWRPAESMPYAERVAEQKAATP